jgi:hypothetical protein
MARQPRAAPAAGAGCFPAGLSRPQAETAGPLKRLELVTVHQQLKCSAHVVARYFCSGQDKRNEDGHHPMGDSVLAIDGNVNGVKENERSGRTVTQFRRDDGSLDSTQHGAICTIDDYPRRGYAAQPLSH